MQATRAWAWDHFFSADARLDVSGNAAWVFVQAAMHRGKTPDALVRLRRDTVREVDIPNHVVAMAAGTDGSVWLDLYRKDGPTLARREGKDWTRFKADDGVRPIEPSFGWSHDQFDVGPDGSMWPQPVVDDSETDQPCRGLADFDGELWREYLGDHGHRQNRLPARQHREADVAPHQEQARGLRGQRRQRRRDEDQGSRESPVLW